MTTPSSRISASPPLERLTMPNVAEETSLIQEAATFVKDIGSGPLAQLEASLLIQKISAVSPKNHLLARKVLRCLLACQNEIVQAMTIQSLTFHLTPASLAFDVDNKQAHELIDLEKQASTAIETYIRLGESKNLILPYLALYEEIIEHLWLLPFLQEDMEAHTI
ncbi:MAG: hypothetical protein K940chlam7_01919, partial [Chlamydiae bacterium]|nr:hypothetical protein [Chlamydiota bacterium]